MICNLIVIMDPAGVPIQERLKTEALQHLANKSMGRLSNYKW